MPKIESEQFLPDHATFPAFKLKFGICSGGKNIALCMVIASVSYSEDRGF
jgi:hypothetical protein